MRLCWCVIVSLVTWKASGQAPGDHVESCRTGVFAMFHDFPPDWEILIDTYDYFTLFSGQSNLWSEADFDGDGDDGWIPSGSACTDALQACSFQSGTQPQNNWLFSQRISYVDAIEVIFNVTFSFSQCRENGGCSNEYVTLYRYDTNVEVTESMRSDRTNYVPLLGTVSESRLQQLPMVRDVEMNYHMFRPEAATGFYLGIQDDGTCGIINRIIAYYRVVRGRTQDLLTCPDVAVPQQGTNVTSQNQCECGANASPTSATLDRICRVNSLCNEDQACACSPGFELNNRMCRACLEGQYKVGVSNSTCLQCPINSESRGEGNAICPCILPNIRNAARPQDPCTAPPSSPRLLLTRNGVPQVSQSSITVCWLPALDMGGLNDLHYNIYLYDTADSDPVFNRVNKELVVQEEGGDNQTSICYELRDINTQTSYGVIVVSANGATGDPMVLRGVDEVQDHSVVFFLTLGEDLVPVGGSDSGPCNVAVAVVVTLFITLIATAAVTALLVVVIFKFCFNKTPPTEGVKYQNQNYGYEDKPNAPGSISKHPPARKPPPTKPSPPGDVTTRKPPPPPRPPMATRT